MNLSGTLGGSVNTPGYHRRRERQLIRAITRRLREIQVATLSTVVARVIMT